MSLTDTPPPCFCGEFVCPLCVCVGSHLMLRFPPTIQGQTLLDLKHSKFFITTTTTTKKKERKKEKYI